MSESGRDSHASFIPNDIISQTKCFYFYVNYQKKKTKPTTTQLPGVLKSFKYTGIVL